ncbi:MAG: glycerate kinase [Spirochaetes bacterium RBG_13_51_14]|nr:MAG: glycerate kinase [Spirochaetes bacterium RBG_13_51_14]
MSNIRQDLHAIYSAAIAAVNPAAAIRAHVDRIGSALQLHSRGRVIKKIDLDDFKRIIIVGAGKATAAMARAIEDIVGDRIDAGCICVKYGYTVPLAKIETVEASHPVPDANGAGGARRIMGLLASADEHDLVISLISGGGSALLPLPPDGITLDEKRETTSLLLKSGAGIHEVNAVRKHLSLIKGGNMARAARRATMINLMISDVVGDTIDVIASGPCVPDNSTFCDALQVLERYGLAAAVPASVLERITAGARGEVEENPGTGSPVFLNVTNLIIASNIIALEAAKDEAARLGYHSIILSSLIEGDTGDAAFWHSRIAREIAASSNPVPAPACILSGGETTVIVTGDGLGGRNMEFSLHAALFIDGHENITVASIGTDGTDGPTDAAGAVVDGLTVRRSQEGGKDIHDYIRRNDSYHFHENLGNLIVTGPTNTNVMDIRIMLVV